MRADQSHRIEPARDFNHVHNSGITGPAGFGKTSFCKWNALQDAKAYLDNTAKILPFYIPLHQVRPLDHETLEEAAVARDDLRGILSHHAGRGGGGVRLYLDGLDEVPEVSRQQAIMELAREEIVSNPNVSIVVTAREHVSGPGWLPRLRISDLSEPQIQELIANWLDNDAERVKQFCDQLERLPALRHLMKVPLLGTLIIAVFRRTGAIPRNRIHLYQLFTELHCGGWDLVKNVRREAKFGQQDKEIILSRFAARLHYAQQREGTQEDFAACVRETLPGFGKTWRVLLDEIIEDSLLSRAGSNFLFSHLSFQEYLTARYLAEPEGHKATSILKIYLRGEEWWKEVLAFYVGMYSRPQVVLRWIEKQRIALSTNAVLGEQANIQARCDHLEESIRAVYPACSVDATL